MTEAVTSDGLNAYLSACCRIMPCADPRGQRAPIAYLDVGVFSKTFAQ